MEEIEEWIEDNESFSFDINSYIKNNNIIMHADNDKTLIENIKDIEIDTLITGSNRVDKYFPYHTSAIIKSNHTIILYTFLESINHEGIEITIEAQSDFPARIKYYSNVSYRRYTDIIKIISDKYSH